MLKQHMPEIEGDYISPVDMVTKMFMAYPLVGAITGTRNPQQDLAKPGMVRVIGEKRIVRALMDQVGRDYHGMGKQQHTQPIQCDRFTSYQVPANGITGEHIGDGQRVGCGTV